MKSFILGFIIFIFSISSYADESYCDVSSGEIPKEQVVTCAKNKIESNEMLSSVAGSLGQYTGIASEIASYVFKENVVIEAKSQYTFLNVVFKIISLAIDVARICFLIAGGLVVCSILLKGAERGQMTTKEKFIWACLITILTTLMFFGGSTLVVQVFSYISLFIGLVVFFIVFPTIYSEFENDVSSLHAELNQKATEFATAAVNSQIEMNLDDIVETRKLYSKFIISSENGKYKIGSSYDLVACINSSFEKPSSLSFYVPPVIAKISVCVTDKLSYKTYTVGYVEDKKDDKSVSSGIMKMISDSNPEARSIALKIANNPCSMAYEAERQNDSFVSACLNTGLNGNIQSDDGYATFATDGVILRTQILSDIKALKEKYRATAYAEMIKYALSKKSTKKVKVEFEKLSKILKVGLQDDKEYKSNALQVIKVDFVNNVIVKAGNLQQGFDLVSNLVNFTDTTDELDVKDYFNTITASDGSEMKGKLMSALNTLTGNGVTNLGLQYEDCYQKTTCFSGAKNPLKTVYQTSETVQTTLTGLSLGAYATGKFIQLKAETLTQTDPVQKRRGVTLENIGKTLFIINALLATIVIVIFKITILRVIEDFFAALLLTLSSGLIVTLAFCAVFLHFFWLRDDYFTVQDLVKKMNVYKILLSIPLIAICFALTLAVAPSLLFVMSTGLNAVFNAELADMYGVSGIGDFMLFLMQIIIYISAFITAYAIIYKEFYEKAMEEVNEMFDVSGRHHQEGDYAYGKVKGVINKMV